MSMDRSKTKTTPSTSPIIQEPSPSPSPSPAFRIPKEIQNLLAGGTAGMAAKTVVAPVDRIKILYQVSNIPFRLRDVPTVAANIVKQEGWRGLWRGNTATMIRIFPYAGTQFMVFNSMKTFFSKYNARQVPPDECDNDGHGNANLRMQDQKWNMTTLQSLFAGAFAGASSTLMTYPLDLTRAQLAILKKQKGKSGGNVGFTSVLSSNYSNGGLSGLFRGITPSLLGILPYAGVAFAINEQTRRQIYNLQHREPTVWEKMLCGGLAGLVAQSMTYPFEVTRRRMQTMGIISTSKDTSISVLGGNVETKAAYNAATVAEHHVAEASNKVAPPVSSNSQLTKHPSSSSSSSSPTMIRIMKQVMKEQGINGFFKGLTMNWLKGPVSFAISFTTFDLIKDLINQEDEAH